MTRQVTPLIPTTRELAARAIRNYEGFAFLTVEDREAVVASVLAGDIDSARGLLLADADVNGDCGNSGRADWTRQVADRLETL